MKAAFSLLAPCWLALSVFLQADPHRDPNPIPPPEELDLTEILVGMSSEDFETREGATMRLLEMSRPRLAAVSRALFKAARTSPDPEIRFRSKETFRKIFEFRVLGIGDSNLGVLWHIHLHQPFNGPLQVLPLVRQIQPESPAQIAGLKPGDIVHTVNGKALPPLESLPTLRRILRESDPGQQIELSIRNVQLQSARYASHAKGNRKVVLTVRDSEKGLREAEPGEFEKWYQNLKALYDKAP